MNLRDGIFEHEIKASGKPCPVCGEQLYFDGLECLTPFCVGSDDPEHMEEMIREKHADFEKYGEGDYGHYWNEDILRFR